MHKLRMRKSLRMLVVSAVAAGGILFASSPAHADFGKSCWVDSGHRVDVLIDSRGTGGANDTVYGYWIRYNWVSGWKPGNKSNDVLLWASAYRYDSPDSASPGVKYYRDTANFTVDDGALEVIAYFDKPNWPDPNCSVRWSWGTP